MNAAFCFVALLFPRSSPLSLRTLCIRIFNFKTTGMYLHLNWKSDFLTGKVFYAPKAIKNLILVKFDQIINRHPKNILLSYKDGEWNDYQSLQEKAFIALLIRKLKNVVRLVQYDDKNKKVL